MTTKLIKPHHVFIGIPSGDMLHADFTMSLAAMLMYSFANLVVDISFSNMRGSDIAKNRNMLMRAVVDANKSGKEITHILMLDSDMVFPPDLLEIFLLHNKDFVGACYSKRVEPFERVGTHFDPDDLRHEFQDISPLGSPVRDTRLHTMAFVPLGCALMRVECLKKLTLPYFAFETLNFTSIERCWNAVEETNMFYADIIDVDKAVISKAVISISEDYYFICRLRAAGYDVWCDENMSLKVAHVGIKHYTL